MHILIIVVVIEILIILKVYIKDLIKKKIVGKKD